jgi:hypothetical protein
MCGSANRFDAAGNRGSGSGVQEAQLRELRRTRPCARGFPTHACVAALTGSPEPHISVRFPVSGVSLAPAASGFSRTATETPCPSARSLAPPFRELATLINSLADLYKVVRKPVKLLRELFNLGREPARAFRKLSNNGRKRTRELRELFRAVRKAERSVRERTADGR